MATMKDEHKTKNQVIAEEILRESGQRYRSFILNFQGIAFRGSMDYTPIFFHGAVEKITGYTEDEFTAGKPRWDQVIHPDDLPRILEDMVGSIPNYSSQREYRIIRKDGEIRWVHEFIQNVCDDSEKPAFLEGVIYDITGRKKVEEALRESEEKYRSVVERANDGICIIQDGIVKYLNPRLANMWGETAEKFIDTPFIEHLDTDNVRKMADFYKRRMAGEDVTPVYDITLKRKDGSRLDAEVSAGVTKYKEKLADLIIVRDLTERKQIEKLSSSLIDSSPIGIYIIQSRKFKLVNPTFQKIIGYAENELVDMDPFSIAHPEDRHMVRENAVKMLKGERLSPYEYRYICKNGEIGWVAEYVVSVEYQGKRATLGNFMDITERKLAEEALRQSEER